MQKCSVRLPDNQPEFNLGEDLKGQKTFYCLNEISSPRSTTLKMRCCDAWDVYDMMMNNEHHLAFTFISARKKKSSFCLRSSVHAWLATRPKIQKSYSNDSISISLSLSLSRSLCACNVGSGEKGKNNRLRRKEVKKSRKKSFGKADDVFFAIEFISPKKKEKKEVSRSQTATTFSPLFSQNSSCMRWPPNGIFSLEFWLWT